MPTFFLASNGNRLERRKTHPIPFQIEIFRSDHRVYALYPSLYGDQAIAFPLFGGVMTV